MLGSLTKNLELDNRIPCIHKYIHGKIVSRDSKVLKDLAKEETKIQKDKIEKFLFINMIPKGLHNIFLKEMESYGLIKIQDKRTIEILNK